MSLEDQFALFFPVAIHSVEEMEGLAAEMKSYAGENPFDFGNVAKQAEDSSHLKTEHVGGLVRVRGYDPSLFGNWQKMVTFDDGQTPPYQITYVEGSIKNVEGTVQQLSIVYYTKEALDPKMVMSMAAFFWDYDNKEEWNSIKVMEGTPPYVSVLARIKV